MELQEDIHTDLISVVIPTKDRPLMVARAIDSVLRQTYKKLEVIVVDDGSSAPLILKQRDPRIRVIRNTPSVGGAAARNKGLKAARGEYVCFLDDDDYYLPGKIEKQIAFLNRHPDVDMVFSRVALLNEKTGYYILPLSETLEPIGENGVFDLRKNFYNMNKIHTNSTLFRKRVFKQVTFDERLQKYQDTQFHLAVASRFNIAFLPEIVAIWNVDERGDRVNIKRSSADYRKDYESFKLLCQIFSDVLEGDAGLLRVYYGRLAFLAMRAGESEEARSLLRKCRRDAVLQYQIYRGVLKFPWLLGPYHKRRLPPRQKLQDNPALKSLCLQALSPAEAGGENRQ